MSVIIRLQNLPWSANASDIRQFFHGLSIPEGGVHIVGGELGDAFIAFSTDEDARQAFNRSSGKIKEIQIKLLLSSRTEMQKVIETARNQTMAAFMTPPPPPQPIMPAIVPAAVPEIKKDEKPDRRSRRRSRSRSRSRDRKDRSYERGKRRRDRSRSKSRERSSRDRNSRDRRRRERSRSRDRTRSRDRDRKGGRRSGGNNGYGNNQKEPQLPRVIWEPPMQNVVNSPPADTASLLANFMANNILPNIIQQQHQQQQQPQDKLLDAGKGNQNSRWEHNNAFSNNSNDSFQDKSRNADQSIGYNNQNRRAEENAVNCCVKVEPFFGSFSEIRRFFNGLYIQNNGIKIINDEQGKRTGIVYVKFAMLDGKDDALRRSGEIVRNNTVNVAHITDEVFDQAVDRFLPGESNTQDEWSNYFGKTIRVCLVMDNVPEYIKEDDVKDMFADFNLLDVVIEHRQKWGNSVYMKFANSMEAGKALKDKSKHVVEGRTLKVDWCDDELYEKIKSEFGREREPIDKDADIVSNTILITGLPMKCSERDIIDFFSDIGVMPSKINMISDELGFNGEAVCEFFTTDAAGLSLQKNGMAFGLSTISIKLQPPANPSPGNYNAPHHPPHMNHPHNNQNYNSNYHMNHMMHNNHHPHPRMPYPPPFNNNMYMNHNRPPFFPRNFMGPRGPPRFPMGNHPMGPRGPRGRFNPQGPPPQIDDDDEDLAPAGCILLMENVPYKAGLDEIMQFLDGYDVPSENILRKYNQNGLPSGETKVIFNSPNEVYQVIEDKKGCKIRERTVYLSQL